MQDGVQGAAQPRQDPVLADVVHQPDHRHTAGLPGGDGAGDNVGQQLAVLPGRPHIIVEVGIVEIPPPQVPGVLAGGMGCGGHAQGDQVGGRFDFLQPQVPLHGGQRVAQRLGQLVIGAPSQPVVVGDASGLPSQKLVEGAGVGPDVVAGQHVGVQKAGQRIHQFQAHAVVSLGGHPDADPHIGPARRVGQYVSGGAHIAAVLFGHGELGHTAAPGIVVVVEFRAIEQRQPHVKVLIDEVDDGPVFAQSGQTECYVRQWPNLPSPAASRR